MDTKTKVVVNTYSSSWINAIILGLIIGMVGYLISQNFNGFIIGFAITFFCEIILLASFIPYVGIWFQWIWSLQVGDWLIKLGNFTASQTATFHTLIMFPIILFIVFGAIIFAVITVVATVLIGALIGALR